MTAPTEQEIREAAQEALLESRIDITDWVHELVRPLRYIPPGTDNEEGYEPGLWIDLRPTQYLRLSKLVEDVYEQADQIQLEVEGRIIDLVVKAGLTFGAEYPDAPRKPQPIPA